MKMKCMKRVFYPHASTRTGSVKKKYCFLRRRNKIETQKCIILLLSLVNQITKG